MTLGVGNRMALDIQHDATRILAIDRISKIVVEDEPFSEPESFDPDKILSHTFDLTLDDPVTVTIRFAPASARRVRNRRWSATQEFHEHADGSVTLTMTTSGTDDIVRWVLGFAGEAQILEPASLRAHLQDTIASLKASYQDRG